MSLTVIPRLLEAFVLALLLILVTAPQLGGLGAQASILQLFHIF